MNSGESDSRSAWGQFVHRRDVFGDTLVTLKAAQIKLVAENSGHFLGFPEQGLARLAFSNLAKGAGFVCPFLGLFQATQRVPRVLWAPVASAKTIDMHPEASLESNSFGNTFKQVSLAPCFQSSHQESSL